MRQKDAIGRSTCCHCFALQSEERSVHRRERGAFSPSLSMIDLVYSGSLCFFAHFALRCRAAVGTLSWLLAMRIQTPPRTRSNHRFFSNQIMIRNVATTFLVKVKMEKDQWPLLLRIRKALDSHDICIFAAGEKVRMFFYIHCTRDLRWNRASNKSTLHLSLYSSPYCILTHALCKMFVVVDEVP
jgi:hypothetical protein